jgi:hypothetical protein
MLKASKHQAHLKISFPIFVAIRRVRPLADHEVDRLEV